MAIERPEPTIESLQQEVQALRDENAVLRQKLAFAEEEKLELTDPLTNLYNRRGFLKVARLMLPEAEEGAHEKRSSAIKEKKVAVLALDLDNFKVVNDLKGHPEGDRILKEAAVFLERSVRNSDVVARVGGEEFIILFNNSAGQDVINKFFDQTAKRSRLGFETEFEGKTIRLSFSGGVSAFAPGENIGDLDAVIARADAALLKAKEEGKDRIEPSLAKEKESVEAD